MKLHLLFCSLMFLCNFFVNILATAKYAQSIIGSNTCLLLYGIICIKGFLFCAY